MDGTHFHHHYPEGLTVNLNIHSPESDKLLTEIGRNITTLLEGQKTIMAGQTELDAAIAALGTDLDAQTTAIDTAVQAIIDKLTAAGNPVDLQPEIDALTAISTKLDTVKDQLPQTATPPPAP